MLHTLRHTAAHCDTLQHTANTLQTHCNTLQHTATHCNTLLHALVYCNTQLGDATATFILLQYYICCNIQTVAILRVLQHLSVALPTARSDGHFGLCCSWS